MPSIDPEQQAQKIKEALFSGQKIQAIKLYREQTSAGLAESKAAIEKLEDELRVSSPESFSKPAASGTGGCVGVLLGFGAVSGTLAWWLTGH